MTVPQTLAALARRAEVSRPLSPEPNDCVACTWRLNDQGAQPNQVAAQAGTDVKMTSQVLRSLERKGLIERDVDAADARARRLRVTERGDALARRAITVVEDADARFFDAVATPATLRLLRRLAGPAAAGDE